MNLVTQFILLLVLIKILETSATNGYIIIGAFLVWTIIGGVFVGMVNQTIHETMKEFKKITKKKK